MDFTKNITFFCGGERDRKNPLCWRRAAVAYGFNPEGGTLNYRFSTYDDVSELGKAVKITKGVLRPEGSYFFRAESFFNVATKAEDYKDLSSGARDVWGEGRCIVSLTERAFWLSFNRFRAGGFI